MIAAPEADPSVGLTRLPASRTERRTALVLLGLFAVLAAWASAFGRDPGPPLNSTLPLLTGWVIATELLSACVLLAEFTLIRRLSLALLGSAYLLAGALAVPYILMFPGIFPVAAEALGANGGSSLYLWLVWHAGFPALVTLATLLGARPDLPAREVRPTLQAVLLGALAVAVAASVVATRFGAYLPLLVVANHFTPLTTFGLLPLLLALDATAMVVIYRFLRLRTTISLWLFVAVACSGLDSLMGLSTDRWSYNWYLGKFFMVGSSTVVLAAFIADILRLQRQLKGVNEKLRAANLTLERVDALTRVTTDIILFVDAESGTIVDANLAAESMLGYTREELIGADRRMVLSPGSERLTPEQLEHGVRVEQTLIRKDRTTFPVESFARLTEIGGRRLIVGTSRDITERYQAREQISLALDQALESSRLKSEFVATMSHEIRTPMNGVVGMTDILLRTPLAADQREYALTVKESAHALLTIINDILDFSKMEAGKIDLESIDFDPTRVVDGVAKLLQTTAAGKGIDLSIRISPHVPPVVRGDPTRLRQILVNLAGNAIKFTERGTVEIVARLETELDGQVMLRFDVVDSGIGMTDDQQERLFQAFVQADGSTTRRYGGTGLGLAISRRLVELMGGTIGVSSAPGEGSTFSFTARFARGTSITAVDVGEARVPRGLRLLVVDDDRVSRRTLVEYLWSWDFSTAEAADADSAFAQLAEGVAAGRPFDVVLLDYAMPRKDGLTVGREIRSGPYGLPAMIMVTAFDAQNRREDVLRAGFSAYLIKPVDPSALYNALAKIAAARAGPAQHGGAEASPASPSRGVRILLAEDQKTNRRVALLQLKELGYDADAVTNGAEAIEAVATGTYDVVLMDMQMPEVDGLDASRAIRAAEVQTGRHIPIVALTANALERDRRACAEAGMDDYLAKPLEINALRDVLDRWLPVPALSPGP